MDINKNNSTTHIDLKNSVTIEDSGIEFGRDISYGNEHLETVDKSSTNDESPNYHSNTELKTEELSFGKENDNLNSTGKLKTPKKFEIPNSFGSVCVVCSKAVYPMEQLMYDKKCYHKGCLKCCKCSKTLSPTVVSNYKSNIFCKPHYVELFRKRGRYDDINAEDNAKELPVVLPNNIKDLSLNSSEKEGIKLERDITVSVKAPSADYTDSNQANSNQSNFSVAHATKAWTLEQEKEWKRTDSNNSDNNDNNQSLPLQLNPNATVKNLTTKFE